MSYTQIPVKPVGGRLVLDFLNTANWSKDGEIVHEKLVSPGDVDIWKKALGLSAQSTPTTPAELATLKTIRAVLRQIVLTAMKPTQGETQPFRTLDDILTGNASTADMRRPALSWNQRVGQVEVQASLTALIMASATALLGDQREVARLKMCKGRACGWLFVDESRNGRRIWCTMETCGNRAKARRHYARSASSHAQRLHHGTRAQDGFD